MSELKDVRLAALADTHNVARFASFTAGDCRLRYAVGIDGEGHGLLGKALVEEMAARLLANASSVNVRTFRDDQSKSTKFRYGLRSAREVADQVIEYAELGLFTIINETIDVEDGGVSGVSMAGIMEFAPGDTPRVVEDLEKVVASLPAALARSLLETVYGFEVDLKHPPSDRIEFSIHPRLVGHRGEHVLFWEIGEANESTLETQIRWPNEFSRFMGDKVYGLLLATIFGMRVPHTTVVGRRLAPFSFGEHTGTGETWMRTAPRVATPGLFTTTRGWSDPFKILAAEDPDGTQISSVLAQESVAAAFSGGAISRGAGAVIEGVRGYGDAFMLGATTTDLPEEIVEDVTKLVQAATAITPEVQIEWVHDGFGAWLVQLHARAVGAGKAGVISSGDAEQWLSFHPHTGLDELRRLVALAAEQHAGILVTARVGVTSHVGDILRQAGVPGRLALPD